MPKPSIEELDTAIKKAKAMREGNDDPSFVAKTLLSHNYRIRHLEEVLKIADRYINMGMHEHLHTELLQAIENAKDAEYHTSQHERESFGLE